MKYYIVHDLQGANFMDYTHKQSVTANEIRSLRWEDFKLNHNGDKWLSWSQFTLDFIADFWQLEFEQV